MPLELLLPADQYYIKLKAGPILEQLYHPGKFFWAPALFLYGKKPIHLIKGRYDRTSGQYHYRIEQMSDTEFQRREEPLIPLRVESDQRAAVVRCKLRPVILLSQHVEKWKDGKRMHEEAYLVAPVYSFRGDDGKEEYSPAFIERVKAYTYNTFFYLPPSTSPNVLEGFVRFDRLQAIHKDQLQHMAVMLTDDAVWLIQSWLWHYLGADLDRVNDVLFDYREEAMRALKEAGLL